MLHFRPILHNAFYIYLLWCAVYVKGIQPPTPYNNFLVLTNDVIAEEIDEETLHYIRGVLVPE